MVTFTSSAVLSGRYERDEESGTLREIEPPRPCPEILTEEETIRYLRLDETDTKNPGESLARYRTMGRLRAVQLGRQLRYRRTDLDEFVKQQRQDVPR